MYELKSEYFIFGGVMGLLVLVITTVAEVLGLAFWMQDAHDGHFYRGLIWLAIGEAIEVAVFIAFLYRGPDSESNRSAFKVIARIVAIGLFELIVWICWWYATQWAGVVVGVFLLGILMHAKHDADVAAISDTRLFRTVFTLNGFTATGLEVLGAIICFLLVINGYFLVGLGLLMICITIEHFVGGAIVSNALNGRHFLTRNPDQSLAEGPDSQNAIMVIADVEPAKTEKLVSLLQRIGDDIKGNSHIPFDEIEKLHFCSFFVAGELSERPQLIFEANVDGEAHAFFLQLVKHSASGLQEIFSHCRDCPVVTDEEHHMVEYLLGHTERVNTFFVGLPGMTLDRIRKESALRISIESHLENVNHHGQSPKQIRQAIQQFVHADPSFAWAEKAFPPEALVVRFGKAIIRNTLLFVISILAAFVLGVTTVAFSIIKIGIAAVWLLVMLLLFSAWFVWRFRQLEKTDKVADNIQTVGAPAGVMRREDHQELNHLANIAPIKPGRIRLIVLRSVLFVVDRFGRYLFTNGSLGGTATIHFARWQIINNNKDLLFLSNYDGSWESYLGDFVDKSSTGLTAIWSNTAEFPRAR